MKNTIKGIIGLCMWIIFVAPVLIFLVSMFWPVLLGIGVILFIPMAMYEGAGGEI